MNRLLHDHPPECICEGVCFVVDAVRRGRKIWCRAWELSIRAGRAINGRELVGRGHMHYDGYFVHRGQDCRWMGQTKVRGGRKRDGLTWK
jgi:hypothetical protein